MKNSTILMSIGLMVLVVGGFVFVNASSGGITGKVIDAGSGNNGEAQKIVLTMDGYNYKTVSAKAGQPIRISADSGVWGCMRSVVFNVGGKKYTKYLETENDVLELPALEKGTYQFACTMGMGFGKLIVK